MELLSFSRREGVEGTDLARPSSNAHTLPRASCATQNEKVAEQLSFLYLSTFPFNKLMSMCLYTKKRALSDSFFILCCGERGIRTPGTSQFNGFQDRRNRPLCHLSFEIGCKITTFFLNTQIFSENSCQYAKNIVILQQNCTKILLQYANMLLQVLKSKIHRVTVTEANLDYIGSITIDEDLMNAANIYAGEKVQIVDNTNGARIETYVIPGKRGSGCICINGAAAHLVHVGDMVIIMAYALMTEEEVKTFKPAIVFPTNNHLA